MTTAVDPPTACPTCGGPFVRRDRATRTMVDYYSSPGHDHDDNCVSCTFHCTAGHQTTGSIQRRCYAPGCTWVGKAYCYESNCGLKWTRWPTLQGNQES